MVRVSEVGDSESCHVPAVPTMDSKSDEETTLLKTKTSAESVLIPKHQCVSTTLISPSVSAMPSTSSISFPVVVVPKLATSAEAYPEYLNRPGGGKDFLCHLCHFRHSNLDSVLTHIRKHLEVTIGCPVCGRGYQNVASLQKHGRDVHSIQIVASPTSLQDVIVPKEEI